MSTLTWTTEKRKVADLKPAEYNPRAMTDIEERDLEESIDQFGTAVPLVINIGKRNNVLIGGHQRTKLYDKRGIKEIDVMVPSRELTRAEEKKLNLRLNKNTGHWDQEKLKEMDLTMLLEVGFGDDDLQMFFDDVDVIDDQFNVPKDLKDMKVPTVKPGEVWQLGDHRIMCGDSTKKEDIEKLMGGVKADMVFSDPPYNMNYQSHDKGGILNDNMEEEKFIKFCEDFMARFKENTRNGGAFYICSGYQSYMPFLYAMKMNGINFAGPIIWVKNSLGMGMNDYRHKHEMVIKAKNEKISKRKKAQPILYGWNGGRHYFADTREEADVWDIKRVGTNAMQHPTQKPIALINRAIKNSSKRGDVILDLFGGSGAVMVAAQKTGRKAYLCELDPKYADVIIKRWEALTGERAKKSEN
jgi:DNA modification methylase